MKRSSMPFELTSLVVLSVIAGAKLGVGGGLTWILDPNWFGWSQMRLFAVLGASVGGFLGIAMSPVVVLTLLRKKLVAALSIIYGPAALIALAAPLLLGMFDEDMAVVGSFFLVAAVIWAGCLVAILLLDERTRVRPGLCAACGYDLTANVSGRCPECGTRIGAPVDQDLARRRTLQLFVPATVASAVLLTAVYYLNPAAIF
jgi:hypothetical protein